MVTRPLEFVAYDMLDQLHSMIEKEIRAASRRIDKAERSNNEPYLDAVTDHECDRTEELLGLAFVVSQVFISSVVSVLMGVSKGCKRKFDQALSVERQRK